MISFDIKFDVLPVLWPVSFSPSSPTVRPIVFIWSAHSPLHAMNPLIPSALPSRELL
jgi:hypothetical protein